MSSTLIGADVGGAAAGGGEGDADCEVFGLGAGFGVSDLQPATTLIVEIVATRKSAVLARKI